MSKREIKDILFGNDLKAIKNLFLFDSTDSDENVLYKFNLWAKYFTPKYFTSNDALFHEELDKYNLKCYREEFVFVDIAFRGAGKTGRVKLFIAYAIANDTQHLRRYFKILSHDLNNAKQIVTDIYNIYVLPRVRVIYPEIFEKTVAKREETMGIFTTATGIKIVSDSVGTNQRGALQEFSRPDFILFEDIENRETLRSAVKTKAIWDNIEEARTSLAVGGSCIYDCNYISEAGNVHKLVKKKGENKKVLIIPIIDDKGVIAWDRYTNADIEKMKQEDEDFEGERLCKPSASADVFFGRKNLDEQWIKKPIEVSNKLRIYGKYDPSCCYGAGHDIGGGVGFDSSTTVIINFSVFPAEVVAVYEDNLIKPDTFGYEIKRQVDLFGGCVSCPEDNNHGHATIAILKQLNVKLYKRESKEDRIMQARPSLYGWNTNAATKPKMLYSLADAIKKGLIILNDEDLVEDIKGYTRHDLLENVSDVRLVTRHFDLVMACAIAWQMKDYRWGYTNNKVKSYKPKYNRAI